MILLKNTTKNTALILLLILCCFSATLQSCKKKRSEMASILYKRTHNKVFKDVDPAEFADFFQKELEQAKSKMNNPEIITAHYAQTDYEPDFVLYHLWDGSMQA